MSFVNPGRVPQMAGAEEVVAAIDPATGSTTPASCSTTRLRPLRDDDADEAHYAFAVSEEFNQRNAGASTEESVVAGERVVDAREGGRRSRDRHDRDLVRLPVRGRHRPGRVLELAARFVDGGADEIVFADTVGVGVPRQVRHLVGEARSSAPVGVHLHNTRSTGYANALVALEAGATVLDASVGGIGGCPFAPRATGNIATEDLVYLLHGEGIETGIDLDRLIEVASWLEGRLGRPLEGQVYKAGAFAPVMAPDDGGEEWHSGSGSTWEGRSRISSWSVTKGGRAVPGEDAVDARRPVGGRPRRRPPDLRGVGRRRRRPPQHPPRHDGRHERRARVEGRPGRADHDPGFAQILHLARSQTPGLLAGWIIMIKPDPPASLADTREAVERMDRAARPSSRSTRSRSRESSATSSSRASSRSPSA